MARISSNDDGKTFSNVLKSNIHENNKTLTANFSDIPRVVNGYYGTLTLYIDSNTLLHKVKDVITKLEVPLVVLGPQIGIDRQYKRGY